MSYRTQITLIGLMTTDKISVNHKHQRHQCSIFLNE
jgi:hypothetical protein